MAYEEIKITRRDMVRSEINSSIDILLAGDFVSAHVLAFAAKAILRGIAKAEKIATIDDIFEEYIKPEALPDWRTRMNAAYNVFKHARDDPYKDLENFRPETTVIAIFTAVVNYGLLYKQRTFPMELFYAWFLSRHPAFLKPEFANNVDVWKAGFGDPEGMTLEDALVSLREMVSLSKQHAEFLFKAIAPEKTKNIEH